MVKDVEILVNIAFDKLKDWLKQEQSRVSGGRRLVNILSHNLKKIHLSTENRILSMCAALWHTTKGISNASTRGEDKSGYHKYNI
ncbi:hypothetical protein N7540_010049 [Penicillium herquei]|nr:hypothetical protein N7540_010049 [Penicillium herquei]